MLAAKTCFVSMPLGLKSDPESGRRFDFDRVYRTLIGPAVSAAGLSPLRVDELSFGAIVHKAIIEAIIASDVFIADLTLGNSNVMYELGIRHALRRGVTVLVSSNQTRVPYDISYGQVLAYALNDSGEPDELQADKFRRQLSALITDRTGADSPIFEFFPQLQVELPAELAASQRGIYPRAVREKLSLKRPVAAVKGKLREVEEAVRNAPEVSPAASLDVLKRYRDLSDWDSVIRFAETLPPSVRDLPEVVQLVALARNRRCQPGDQEIAIAIVDALVKRTGGDSESFGILGRIYKDRHARTGDVAELRRAIDSYRAGFRSQPSDYYPAINLVTLLAISGTEDDLREMRELMPRVRELVDQRIAEEPVDYWELATALELSVLDRDWNRADELGDRIRSRAPVTWMLESTLLQLERLGQKVMVGEDRGRIESLIRRLRPEARNSEEANV